MSAMPSAKPLASSHVYAIGTRVADAGRCAKDSPGRHSRTGRTGRDAKPPPQLGQTLRSLVTQSAHQVHSYVQIIASVA